MGRPPKNDNFESVKEAEKMTIGEIGSEGVAVATENDFYKGLELEKFMNEKVLIEVSSMRDEGDLMFIPVNVNGVNQPIRRGQPQLVKRKYVEALARSRHTTYEQVQIDPFDPSKIDYRPVTRVCYPFTVIRDNNPMGHVWLRSLREQPEL